MLQLLGLHQCTTQQAVLACVLSASLCSLADVINALLVCCLFRRCVATAARFADCLHVAEPGCAVSSAGLERYEHYIKFLAEIKVRTREQGKCDQGG